MQSVHPPSGAGMTCMAEKLLSVCPVVVAALLLLARTVFESIGLASPATAGTRSRKRGMCRLMLTL